MNDAQLVGSGERFGHVVENAERLGKGEVVGPDEPAERLPFDILHDDVGHLAFDADIVDANDMRVDELRGGAGFALEAGGLANALPHQLHRDGAVEFRLQAEPDFAHRPRPELAEDFVLADEGGAGRGGTSDVGNRCVANGGGSSGLGTSGSVARLMRWAAGRVGRG